MSFPPSTYDDLIELWRSLFPRGFTAPIEDEGDGQGFDGYAAQIRMTERVSHALNVTTQAYYLRPHSGQTAPPAAGARRAVGTVEVTRLPPATGPITLIAGVELVADVRTIDGTVLDGIRLRVTTDTTLPAGALGPFLVPIEAVRVGYQGNLRPGTITRFAARGRASIVGPTIGAGNAVSDTGVPDRWTLAMVGQYVRILGGPNGGTIPRRILSVTPSEPISVAVLDGPALIPGPATSIEVEEFAELGLTVSQPLPLTGGRHGWLDAIGRDRGTGRTTGEDDETYRSRLVFLADTISPAAIIRICHRILDPFGIAFVFEEPPFPSVRFFRIRVAIRNWGEYGAPYDALEGTPDSPFAGPNAYDTPVARGNFYDGHPVQYDAVIDALIQAIDQAKAAGVDWELVYDVTL